MSFSVFEKIDPSCQNGSMEKAKNLPYHQRPYASIAERTLVDISIYAPRPQIAGTGHSHSKISIHSPRAGRDLLMSYWILYGFQISIHSPRMGRDRKSQRKPAPKTFQSTLPAWGETSLTKDERAQLIFQSTLPERGETHPFHGCCIQYTKFQSTLPERGETGHLVQYAALFTISIHSPRAGRDYAPPEMQPFSRPFQSTLPERGETRLAGDAGTNLLISIHSPRAGRDIIAPPIMAGPIYFNPLSPSGERR